MVSYINMTDDEYEAWAEQYQDWSYTDLLDSLYDRLCEIERLEKKIEDLTTQNEKQKADHKSTIDYYDNRIDDYERDEQHSRDMYKDQDLGPVWS